jgi:signal peptidase II
MTKRKIQGLAAQRMVVVGMALAADQVTKLLVRQSLPLCSASSLSSCRRIDVTDNMGLVRVENAGSVLGFHQGLWIWLVMAVLGLLAIPLYARDTKSNRTAAWAVGLQLAGALGNLSDRVIHGGVTDFIDLGWGPIFNIADVAILAGALLATLLLYPSLREVDPLTGTRLVDALAD